MVRRNPLNGYYALRWKILERDKFTCRYCGGSAPSVHLEIDHVIPLTDGGTDGEDNLVTSCFSCNRGKNALSVQVKRKGVPSGSGFAPHLIVRPRQESIAGYLKEHPEGLTTGEIIKMEKTTRSNTDMSLLRLRKRGIIKRVLDKWFLI